MIAAKDFLAQARPSVARGIVAQKIGKLVVITGPSGVGKSTLTQLVLRRTGAQFSVSVTTRAPRKGEVDGCDYRFVDRATFERMVHQGQLLEWAEKFGQFYGTPAEPVRQALAAGNTLLLDIDVQGGLQVAKIMPEATFVLVVPPGEQELERRLSARNSETPQAKRQRLAQAAREIEQARLSGVYTHVVVNDDLEKAAREIVEIVNA